MYQFILNMYITRRIPDAENNIALFVSKGYITQEEADLILATPQIPVEA